MQAFYIVGTYTVKCSLCPDIVKLQELLYEYMLKYIYGYCILLLLMMVSWEASTKHLLLVCIRVVKCLKCLPLFIGKLSDSGHGRTVAHIKQLMLVNRTLYD